MNKKIIDEIVISTVGKIKQEYINDVKGGKRQQVFPDPLEIQDEQLFDLVVQDIFMFIEQTFTTEHNPTCPCKICKWSIKTCGIYKD